MMATAYIHTETNMPFYFEEYDPDKLREYMLKKSGTLTRFSDEYKIPLPNIKKWVSGNSVPNLDNLGILGQIFGVYFYADWPNEKAPDESEA